MIVRSRPRAGRGGREQGIILLWAAFAAMAIFTSAFVMSTLASSSRRIAQNDLARSQAEHLSEGAVALAAVEVYQSLQNGGEPAASGDDAIDGNAVRWSITRVGGPDAQMLGSGLNQIVSTFRIEGSATVGGVTGTTRTIVQGVVVPLFQFALFYNGGMDFLYPAAMEINGRIHCNSDVYIYSQSGIDFNTNHFTIAGNLYNQIRYPEWAAKYDWGSNDATRVRRYVDDPFDGSEPVEYEDLESKSDFSKLGVTSVGGFDSDFAGWDDNGDGDYDDPGDLLPFAPRVLEQFSEPDFYAGDSGTTLRTGEHGVTKVQTPEIADFDMYVAESGGDYVWNAVNKTYDAVAAGTGTHTKGDFHAAAGLSIILQPNGTDWKAYDALGLDVTDELDDAKVVTVDKMYDARQAEGSDEKIDVLVIEMDKLNKSGYFPANGLLYVAAYGSGTGTDVKGFELTDGEELKADLTVVSPDSVYIQGDYNTEKKKSAAVMADAVNLLSKSWDNSKGPGDLPSASSTTYNTAILTGDGAPAAADSYTGGPHNLPRFHEKWTSKTCTILGSLVCLGSSLRATGTFEVNGDYYKPPTRKWTYDADFNDVDLLPPFTPAYVEVDELVAW